MGLLDEEPGLPGTRAGRGERRERERERGTLVLRDMGLLGE